MGPRWPTIVAHRDRKRGSFWKCLLVPCCYVNGFVEGVVSKSFLFFFFLLSDWSVFTFFSEGVNGREEVGGDRFEERRGYCFVIGLNLTLHGELRVRISRYANEPFLDTAVWSRIGIASSRSNRLDIFAFYGIIRRKWNNISQNFKRRWPKSNL